MLEGVRLNEVGQQSPAAPAEQGHNGSTQGRSAPDTGLPATLAGLSPAEVLDLLTWKPAPAPPPLTSEGKHLPGKALREWVREQSPKVLLGLSFGKDSLATFHALLDTWPREDIVAYWLYPHPHLAWQRRQLRYYRERLGIPIHAVAARSLWQHLSDVLYQPPQHLPTLLAHHEVMGPTEYEALYWMIAQNADIGHLNPWIAHGVRAADSPVRRISITQHGPYNLALRTFYPIWDERKADLLVRLRDLRDNMGVKLPVDYRLWGRTFDGQDYRFIQPLAEAFPDDYDRLREMFPLMDTEFIRRGEEPPR
jgi:hypothetical protein